MLLLFPRVGYTTVTGRAESFLLYIDTLLFLIMALVTIDLLLSSPFHSLLSVSDFSSLSPSMCHSNRVPPKPDVYPYFIKTTTLLFAYHLIHP